MRIARLSGAPGRGVGGETEAGNRLARQCESNPGSVPRPPAGLPAPGATLHPGYGAAGPRPRTLGPGTTPMAAPVASDGLPRVLEPGVAVVGVGLDQRKRDRVGAGRVPRDVRALREDVGRHRGPGGLVDEAAHGRVDRLPDERAQARAVQGAQLLGGAGRGPEQPAGERDALQCPAQRAEAVGIADPALRAGGLDLRAAGLAAGDDAHGVALARGVAREREAAATAADDQQARHQSSRWNGSVAMTTSVRALQRRLEQLAALVVEDLVAALARDELGDQDSDGAVLRDRPTRRSRARSCTSERWGSISTSSGDVAAPGCPVAADLVALVLVAGDGDRDDGVAERQRGADGALGEQVTVVVGTITMLSRRRGGGGVRPSRSARATCA